MCAFVSSLKREKVIQSSEYHHHHLQQITPREQTLAQISSSDSRSFGPGGGKWPFIGYSNETQAWTRPMSGIAALACQFCKPSKLASMLLARCTVCPRRVQITSCLIQPRGMILSIGNCAERKKERSPPPPPSLLILNSF